MTPGTSHDWRSTVSPWVTQYIHDARQAVLAEIQPTPAQLERGLELFRGTIVCDAYASSGLTNWVGHYSEPMRRYALDALRRTPDADRAARVEQLRRELVAWRPPELVHDPVLQVNHRALWDTAGVTVGAENVLPNTLLGPRQQSVPARLWHELVQAVARATYLYDHLPHMEKVTDLNVLPRLKPAGIRGTIWHVAEPDILFDRGDDPGRATEPAAGACNPRKNLDLAYGMGFRSAQLTNSRRSRVGSAHVQDEDEGLTDLGRTLIRRMNELGVMIDLSHSGPRTMLDAIRVSDDPVVATHVACRSLSLGGKSKHRNITDEAMCAVADKGGLVGIITVPNLLGDFGFDAFFRHLDYAVKQVGIDHVCVGTDNGPGGPWSEPAAFAEAEKPATFVTEGRNADGTLRIKGTKAQWTWDHEPHSMSWVNWPYWSSVGLLCRGYREEDIRKIIGENFIRVMRPILAKRPRGKLI